MSKNQIAKIIREALVNDNDVRLKEIIVLYGAKIVLKTVGQQDFVITISERKR